VSELLELLRLLARLKLRRLWRELLIALGIRRVVPRRGERLPHATAIAPAIDLGGAYRPAHRPQDPSRDPHEPTGESSDDGYDHGWSNCTMSAGADVLAYQTRGELTLWGGNLRHAQSDLEGGTSLEDLRDAWARYGETLEIRTGAGWSAVVDAHEQGRAIVISGSGEVPGVGSFTGGHASAIGPETRSCDGAWLFGDPLATDWQWIAPSAIRAWAEDFDPRVSFALSALPPEEPPASSDSSSEEDVMYNVAPLTTHRDAIVRDGAVLYADAALQRRHSVATGDTALGFAGSGGVFHVVVNAGYTNYVRREDVREIVASDREYT